jgi:hypothetical protein
MLLELAARSRELLVHRLAVLDRCEDPLLLGLEVRAETLVTEIYCHGLGLFGLVHGVVSSTRFTTAYHIVG